MNRRRIAALALGHTIRRNRELHPSQDSHFHRGPTRLSRTNLWR